MKQFQRILVLVPHPDDEALLAAGVIRHSLLQGKAVFVALATNGDYLCPDHSKGRKRLQESLAAMASLGLPRENLFFLGYPDTGFEPEVSFLSRLWQAHAAPQARFPSTASDETYALAETVPDYAFARTGTHAPYTRAAFCADLNALLSETQPDLVITTAAEDLHGDHSALFHFVQEAIAALPSARPTLWVGMVHSPDGDLAWPQLTHTTSAFEAPLTHWGTALPWNKRIAVPLPAEMLAENTADTEKYKLIEQYPMALNPAEPDVCAYLLSFAKREEIFWCQG